MTLWLTILGMGVVTYGLRLSFIALAGRLSVPRVLKKALAYVPAAVLAALVLPALVVGEGTVKPLNPRSIAGLLAVFVAWRTRSVFATILVGMVALWMLQTLW